MADVHGCIFVVDSAALDRIQECREVFAETLRDPHLSGEARGPSIHKVCRCSPRHPPRLHVKYAHLTHNLTPRNTHHRKSPLTPPRGE